VTGHPFPRLPGWEVKRQLGSGGQALTYLVHREGGYRTPMVAKVLRPWTPESKQPSERDHRGRFVREVLALSGLALAGCPRIVTVVEHHLNEDGPLWYVMPFFSGGSLAQRIADYRGELDRALRIVGTVAETLAWMHEHEPQHVHRDVHTDNIFLMKDGEEPYLGDFGLVHIWSQDQALKTGEREALGPWRWRPPELHAGSNSKTLPASDVYLLGGVLFELLTGGEFIEETQNIQGEFVHERPEFSIRRFITEKRVGFVETLLRSMLVRDPRARISAREVSVACHEIQIWKPGDQPPLFPGTEAKLRLIAARAEEKSIRRRSQQQLDDLVVILREADAVVRSRHPNLNKDQGLYQFQSALDSGYGLTINGIRLDQELVDSYPGSVWAYSRVTASFDPDPSIRMQTYVLVGMATGSKEIVALKRDNAIQIVCESFRGDPKLYDLIVESIEKELDVLLNTVATQVEERIPPD